ncbi:MAG TPA: HAD family hydrolase [Acidimicrobiales bacterium]|nr:HAD family hydrolase [Acidimicrobiales bacterium]
MIEAVLFDGDQTLWDFERVMRDALVAVVQDLRAALPCPFTATLRWEDLEADRTVVGDEWAGREYNLARLRVLGFARTLARLREAEGLREDRSDEELARELARSYFEHRDRDPALFDDTLPCLQALRAEGRYRIGLLSNGSRLPETVGLAGYFEAVVFAQDHLVAKPEKGIFKVVERELSVRPSCCVLVGDHVVNDVSGAKQAGWSAVWLDRPGDGLALFEQVATGDRRPDAVVTTLDDLPAALDALDR